MLRLFMIIAAATLLNHEVPPDKEMQRGGVRFDTQRRRFRAGACRALGLLRLGFCFTLAGLGDA